MVAHAQAVAGSLRSLGVAPGDRVLLLLRNQPEFHVADLATQLLRATPVSVYSTASAEQIVHVAAHSEAKVAIVADHLATERFACAQSNVPTLHQLVVVDNEETSAVPFTWRDLLRGDLVDLEASAASVRPEDLATVIYTSGTTGTPKGVMISQSNVCWTMDCLKQVYAPLELDKARLVSYLPMAHVAERMTTHYPLLAFGTEITCCPEPNAFVDFLPQVRPHIIIGVPRVFEKLADKVNTLAAETDQIPTPTSLRSLIRGARHSKIGDIVSQPTRSEREKDRYALIRKRLGLDACRVAVTGAAPTPPDVMSSLRMIGLPLSEGYGLSECCGTATLDPYHSRPGTAGRSAPGSELRISDRGEVLIRGGQVFAGYLKDPQATAEAVDGEGWLHTGDLGEIDADGYLRIVGRIKEIIITSGGKNVAPSYIENKLNSHPLIAYSCVIGDRRPYLTALIDADPLAAREWAKNRRLPFRSISEIVGNASFVAEIADAVARVNATLNRPEQVKRFKIIADEWVPGSALVTPTMKVRRTPIIEHYAEAVAQLYDA
jgi:long-subunit acyl-CoA synthetase (AMP-forming)